MIVFGKNVIYEAVLNKHEFYKIWIDKKFNDDKFLAFLKKHNIRYETHFKDKLNELSKNGVHQGIVADIKPYPIYNLKDELKNATKFIILDQVSDPHNLGSIMRSANGAGFDGVIISNKNQVKITGQVAKASAGAVEYVKLIEVSNINYAIKILKDNDFLVIGTSDKAEKLFKEMPKDKKVVIVLGSEGNGIRPLVLRNCDMLVKIPMLGKINSLNVGVAGGLLMYEFIK